MLVGDLPMRDTIRKAWLPAAQAALIVLAGVAAARTVGLLPDGPSSRAPRAPLAGAASTALEPLRPRTASNLVQDAEYVYGPAARGFDTASFLAARGGALARHSEQVGGRTFTAAEIVDLVAAEHSVSPRLLLALVEEASGLVDGPGAPGAADHPLGVAEAGTGLHAELRWAASWLDDGYYGLKYRNETDVTFGTGERRRGPAEGGAAHFAVARYLALSSRPDAWNSRLASFAATYTRLFGPMRLLPAPMPAGGPAQPPLLLPWPAGERWIFTGGPHGAWGIATAWGAVDFAPPTPVGCSAAPEWVVAAAPGIVTHAAGGLVIQDLDSDGFAGTGWALIYLHIAGDGRVPAGTALAAGDRIGHPSCEGGHATGAHLHFARRYNGEWLPAAGGPAPIDLSGWSFTAGGREYEGTMAHEGEATRVAVTGRQAGQSDIVSDNGPDRWAALTGAWGHKRPCARRGRRYGSGAGRLSGGGCRRRVRTGSRDPSGAPGPRRPFHPFRSRRPPRRGGAHRTNGPHRRRRGQWHHRLTSPSRLTTTPSTLRAPGFRPRQVFGVPIGSQAVAVDLSGGGLLPLQSGELTNDDVIDGSDVLAWFGLWLHRRSGADLNGDGRASPTDLARLLGNWGGRRLR